MIASGVFCRTLVGRTEELEQLVRNGRHSPDRRSALVVIRGEAGVGKTRLLAEFVAALTGAGQRAVITPVREYANAPYAAIEEAFEALGVSDVFERVPHRDEGDDEKSRRFALAARTLTSIARASSGGVVIALEDVHWADGATIELFRFLATRLTLEPVTLIATYRLDDGDFEPDRLRALRALDRDAADSLLVAPLSDDEIDSLLHAALRDVGSIVPRHVLDRVRELSDGRPLFAEELLRGALERRDRDSGEVTVPPSMRATVQERFARLGDRDRDILLQAAVVGRRFSASFIAQLTGEKPTGVLGALRRARDLQLVVEEAADESGDAFAFRHAIMREALYVQLLRAEARAMHAHVAEALAHEEPLDVTAIAEHTWRARDVEHAVAWNERAGDVAARLFVYADAARHYGRAYEIAIDDAQRASLAEKAGEALYAAGEVGSAVERLSQAVAALGSNPDAHRLSIRKAYLLFDQGRYDESIKEALAVADQLHDDDSAMHFYAEVSSAGLLVARGRAHESLVHLERADLCTKRGDAAMLARFEGNYAYCLAVLGRVDDARARFFNAHLLAREHSGHDVLMRTLNNNANLELSYGPVSRARDLYAEGLSAAVSTKNLRFVALLAQNSALAALIAGDLLAAGTYQSQVEAIRHDVDTVLRWSLGTELRSSTLRGRNDVELRTTARAAATSDADSADLLLTGALALDLLRRGHADEATALIDSDRIAQRDAEAPYWLYDAAARCGSERSRAAARAALAAVAERSGAWPARGFLALADAREALRKRRRDEAVRFAEAAIAAFRTAGWRMDEAFALELAGRTAEAIALFRAIGATGEVRRIAETATTVQRRRGEATLTKREREVAGLVAGGSATRAIADALVISDRTVETHIAAVYRKLGVANRTALARMLDESQSGRSR